MDDAILNCPFCGSQATIRGDWNMEYLACMNDTCPASYVGLMCHSAQHRAASIAAWNRRAPIASAPAAGGGKKKLVKALEKIAAIKNKLYGGDWEEIEEAREIARAALASPGAEGRE